MPPTALALATAHVDFLASREAVYQGVPEAEHQRLCHLEALLTGLLLGPELSSRILAALEPGVRPRRFDDEAGSRRASWGLAPHHDKGVNAP